jgi:rhamnogalacturonan endolyase
MEDNVYLSPTRWGHALGAGARQLATAGLLAAALLTTGQANAQNAPVRQPAEALGRGVVAVDQGNGSVFVSWRMLNTDGASVGFDLYRQPAGGAAVKVNATPIMTSTNWVDTTPGTIAGTTYSVRPVRGGVALAPASEAAPVWPQQFKRLALQQPATGTTPTGGTYTYSPNDCSVGDLDGDGQQEIIVKWDPSNSQDNSLSGYTGNVYLDAYKLDGTRLWRIDLGKNIRAGAHYTQFMVYDFDGDGKAELACKTADGTVDGTGQVLGSATADYRNANGYILSGPEYLTMFNGQTGAAYPSVRYLPQRHPTVGDNPTPAQINTIWGDNYGNRIDRFLACVAYLDGVHPSLVMCRGYYTRTVLVAWDFKNGQLTQRWTFDSNDGNPANTAFRGQGNHNLSVGDVDGDGKDEIVYGSCAIDDNGQGMYATGRGHGDAMHLSDFDPARPGLEVFSVHETQSQYGSAPNDFRDAATGTLIWGAPGPNQGDVGRGVAMDIDPRYLGAESWSTRGGLYAANGTQISTARPSPINFAVWWDGDLLRENLDNVTISKWNWQNSTSSTLLNAGALGAASNNSTKATPNLSADLFGDWREEVIWRNSNNQELLIFTTTIPTQYRMPTLLQDAQYRLSIAWQNVAYNQPPHTGYYLGDGMKLPVLSQAQQLITFPALPDKLLGDAPFALPATSTSGLAISYASSDTTLATIAGNVVRLRRAGTVTITATQAGDSEYLAAPAASQTLTIAPVLVQVQYQDGDYSNPTNPSIKPTLRLANQGTAAVAYGELTARYWLTPENYSGLVTNINWAALGTSQVRLRYVPLAQPRSGASGYVEYSFDPSVGQLAAGGNSGDIYSQFYNAAYGVLNEADDYSYRAGVSSYAANDRITLYRNGVLVWGTEPAAVTAQLALEVQSENRNGSPRSNTLNTALDVRNIGNQPVRYADLTVRYWFSPDGTASLVQWYDWAKLGASNLTGRLSQQGGQQYLETGFAAGLGTLAPGSSTGDLVLRLRKSDWSNFIEDNDYSYRVPYGYAANDHITAYYQGQLVYGTEPATTSTRQAATTPTLDVRILGNPVTGDNATLEIRGVAGQALELQLLDMQGNPLLTQRVATAEEMQTQQLPVAKLRAGVYLLKVIAADQTAVVRLLRP